MNRFYFHVWRGGQLTPDDDGALLPTLGAAARRAERMASDILAESEAASSDLSGWDIEVTDAAGRTVLAVPVGRADCAKRAA